LRDPTIKQRFVTPMFDLVAPRYDAFTRRFSFGMDAAWKRELVAQAAAVAPSSACGIDVACGTGDLAIAIARRRPDVQVSGLDASARMIELARRRIALLRLPNVTASVGDLTALPVPSESADVITAGYALRNVPTWTEGVYELVRVLRPGGHLFTLDFYRPENGAWRRLFLAYLSAMGNAYGWLWHREPVAYGYIARSIEHFVSWQRFARGLEASGLRVVHVSRRLGGAIAVHHAVKM
jgi:demethylmenaquinone methyltransferase/2-methoxy-6-polyprenyl-1,4-benzoquinol methylase